MRSWGCALASKSRGIQSVEVGHRLLDVLVQASSPMMLRDLAAGADISPAQAHSYLASYRKLEIVEQDRATGQYRLGPFAMRLGLARLRGDERLRAGEKGAAELVKDLGVTVTVSIWATGAPVVIEIQEGPKEININLRQGKVFGVTTTVTGRVFAAFGDARAIRARIKQELSDARLRDTPNSHALSSDFEAAVTRTRVQGYASAVGIALPKVAAVAAPVLGAGGELLFVLTLIGDEAELDVRRGSRHVRALLSTTRKISEQIIARERGAMGRADTPTMRAKPNGC